MTVTAVTVYSCVTGKRKKERRDESNVEDWEWQNNWTEGGRGTTALPPGANSSWPPSACDSQPNRYTERWFKAIITSTLADGWCGSHGCWRLMNETLVNTTKNMIREPPCRQQTERRGKKNMSTQMCLQHHHHPQIHTYTQPPSSLWQTCPVLLLLLSTLEYKMNVRTEDLRRQIQYVCVCLCEECDFFCLLGLLALHQIICVEQGVPPADIHKVALYRQWDKAFQM